MWTGSLTGVRVPSPRRGLFIIDGAGVLRQITMNDLPVGRSVDETLRLVQAFKYTDSHGEVCPAGWKPGADTVSGSRSISIVLTLARFPYFTTFASGVGGGGYDPPGDRPLMVVELRGKKNSRCVSMRFRDCTYCF